MYEIEITKHFSAAHCLVGYPGMCANLHGHNWNVTVYLQASELNEIGIAFDFKELKSSLDISLARYDHSVLNEQPEFREQNPTSENIARELYRELSQKINDNRVKLTRVKVSESEGSNASYFE